MMPLRHEVIFITKDDIVSAPVPLKDKPTAFIYRTCATPFGIFYTECSKFQSMQSDKLEVRRYRRRGYTVRAENVADGTIIQVYQWKMLEDNA